MTRSIVFLPAAVIVCLLSARASFSQATVSGAATMGGAATITGGPSYVGSWSENVRKATLAVGQVEKDAGGKEQFSTGGAAVLIMDSSQRVFIATAKHVFDDPEKKWAPESLRIRGWKDEQTSRYSDLGSELILRKNGVALFTESDDFDLAVIIAPEEIKQRVANEQHRCMAISPAQIGDDNDTYDGADVFVLGFPGLVGELYRHRALMRSGMIAWTDTKAPSSREFLIDSRIFPGNSGGPVFSSAAGMTRDASISSSKPIKLLGLVSQTINAKPELAFGVRVPEDAIVIGNAGVGIIEPAAELLKLMRKFP